MSGDSDMTTWIQAGLVPNMIVLGLPFYLLMESSGPKPAWDFGTGQWNDIDIDTKRGVMIHPYTEFYSSDD